MSTPSTRHRRRLVLALCLLVALPPGGLAAATELGGATPEELVARAQRAAGNQDFAELAACLAPEDRAVTTIMLVAGAAMMTAFAQMGVGLAEELAGGMAEALGAEPAEEPAGSAAAGEAAAAAAEAAALQTRFDEILTRHGVAQLIEEDPEPEATGPEAAARLLADVDQVALIADLMTFLEESFPEEAGGGESMPVPSGQLEDLAIEGDRASGRIGDEPVELVRIDGRWFLDAPMETEPAPPAEEPPVEATEEG